MSKENDNFKEIELQESPEKHTKHTNHHNYHDETHVSSDMKMMERRPSFLELITPERRLSNIQITQHFLLEDIDSNIANIPESLCEFTEQI